jgi:hypothetical protein
MPNPYTLSPEEFASLEAPFREIDPALERFARARAMAIVRNYHNWPARSLKWEEGGVWKQLQLFLSPDKSSYGLFVVAWQDRDERRYWKQAFVKKEVPWNEIADNLEQLLIAAHATLEYWTEADLELAPGQEEPPKYKPVVN